MCGVTVADVIRVLEWALTVRRSKAENKAQTRPWASARRLHLRPPVSAQRPSSSSSEGPSHSVSQALCTAHSVRLGHTLGVFCPHRPHARQCEPVWRFPSLRSSVGIFKEIVPCSVGLPSSQLSAQIPGILWDVEKYFWIFPELGFLNKFCPNLGSWAKNKSWDSDLHM